MNKKVIQKYPSKWQAEILIQRLEEVDIQAVAIFTPREYASVVTGIGSGEYTVEVNEADYDEAVQLAASFSQDDRPIRLVQEVTSDSFRRMMSCVLLSVLLPVVFHIAATTLYMKLLNQNVSSIKKLVATFFLVACWILLYFQISYIYFIN